MGQLGCISRIVCWCYSIISVLFLVVPSTQSSPRHGKIYKITPHIRVKQGADRSSLHPPLFHAPVQPDKAI